MIAEANRRRAAVALLLGLPPRLARLPRFTGRLRLASRGFRPAVLFLARPRRFWAGCTRLFRLGISGRDRPWLLFAGLVIATGASRLPSAIPTTTPATGVLAA